MKILTLILMLSVWSSQRSSAYLLTEDIPMITHSVISQIANYAQYVAHYYQGLTQILNQLTSIENQVVQLERYGNPQTYVGMLHLDEFMAGAEQLKMGIGNQIAFYRSQASGIDALRYTGGLYADLTGRLDRFGNPIQWDTNAFRKFGAVNLMLEDYNTAEKTYNTRLASLLQQLATATRNLDSDRTQIGRETYAAQIQGLSAQINALGHTTNLAGQRLAIQQSANQNDAARVQEATRQQEAQERAEDLQNQSMGWARFIGAQ